MIYLASPYSHPDPRIMEARYHLTRGYCAMRMQLGETLISPIVYGHQFAAIHDFKTDYKSWLTFNEDLLSICHTLRVLKLNGWMDSAGVAHELEYAQQHGLDIQYAEPL